MRFVIFTHSLVSDWNHGNAHFLRGIASELVSRGHELRIFEPEDGWSRRNLLLEQGENAIEDFERVFPHLRSTLYNESTFDLDDALRGADVVLVHEWNSPDLISRIGRHRARHDYTLFFHDTHHRSLTERDAIAAYDLTHFDAVLAYGNVIRDAYLKNGWARCACTWHEAADTRIFHPFHSLANRGDVVWIGNWGDDERADALREFLIEPVRELGLRACVFGVRYPPEALLELASAGIEYGGWLRNYNVPHVFAQYRVTIHVPRRPYVKALPGIPTIRPFEALACGIPLISAPWTDSEHLFSPGKDFLFAQDKAEMKSHLDKLLTQPALYEQLRRNGLDTIRSRHTCAHRVDELFSFLTAPEAVCQLQGKA
ncbi:MAG TPA: glycosyltransferase [Bryobacteraceae bacterium]|nr:glycosyltransferase [Bryobacteraceae bacterium]